MITYHSGQFSPTGPKWLLCRNSDQSLKVELSLLQMVGIENPAPSLCRSPYVKILPVLQYYQVWSLPELLTQQPEQETRKPSTILQQKQLIK